MNIINLESDYQTEYWFGVSIDFKFKGKVVEAGSVISSSVLQTMSKDLQFFLLENDLITRLGVEEDEKINNSIKIDTSKCNIIKLK